LPQKQLFKVFMTITAPHATPYNSPTNSLFHSYFDPNKKDGLISSLNTISEGLEVEEGVSQEELSQEEDSVQEKSGEGGIFLGTMDKV
jgi:hypothetical protein